MRKGAKDRQRLVDDNAGLVRSIAAKLKESLPREIDFDDLVGYGMQGLLEAAERFDARHGTAFSTFAYYRVRGAMLDGLRGMGFVPRHEYGRMMRFEERAAAYLQNLADREHGAARAAGGGGFVLEQELRELAEALGGVAAIFVTALETRDEQVEPAPHKQAERKERNQAVKRALDVLPDKERRLIELYYFEDRPLEEAGRLLGLSKSWASRLHARAVDKLKAALARDPAVEAEELRPRPGKTRARR